MCKVQVKATIGHTIRTTLILPAILIDIHTINFLGNVYKQTEEFDTYSNQLFGKIYLQKEEA